MRIEERDKASSRGMVRFAKTQRDLAMDITKRNTKRIQRTPPRSSILDPRAAFTLVELLVVIVIIGILASLITVAAVNAIKHARRTQVKAEINEITNAVDELKNKTTAYPPNCQTDGTGATNPLNEADVLNDLRRYLQQMAPRSQESDDLARVLTGQQPGDTTNYPNVLSGGISAAEAVVFWLGGFGSDPKYPISGNGGPSYAIAALGDSSNASRDPIESRKWVYPFDISRLGPRDSNKYFNGRYIEYKAPNGQLRRINFWTYTPSKSEQPLVYFDTSRHPVGVASGSTLNGRYDPPAATYSGAGDLAGVYAFKKAAETPVAGTPQIQFINPDKFQVFHCGIDGEWDTAAFKKMAPAQQGNSNVASNYLLFPTGPYVGEFADSEVNFATETTIEDAQK